MPQMRIRASTPLAPTVGALRRAWQTTVVALTGLVIVVGVGFASLPSVHDAAHDMRHSFNFPCH